MYQALYRRYRPKSFDEVVGQKIVVETLKNSIVNNKISHAYMFFGPRGIGKTTIAKIFSRAVNCLNAEDGNPCEKCENCIKSKDNNSVDIIEIDAASNNGVDEIREIKSKVNIVPSELKYKVYIIDEVHMLTSGAFNALLKTLEEPPKHVIFILATTDPQKVSDTIISRCQCYSFKRISIDDITSKLLEVSKKEKIDVEKDVLIKIAEYSNGGLRDSLGVLDKLSSYKTTKIDIDDFYEINDMISSEEIDEFKNNILYGKTAEVIENILNYNNNGKNLVEIMSQLLFSLRNDIVNYYIKLDNNKNIDNIYKLINLINEKMFDIKKSGNPKIFIEILLLNYISKLDLNNKNISREIISQEIKNPDIVKKKKLDIHKEDKKEDKANIIIEEQKKTLKICSNISEIMKIRVNNVFSLASREEKINDQKLIDKLNEYVFNQEYGYIVSEIMNSKLRASSKDCIILSFEYDSVVEKNQADIEKITDVYQKLTGTNKKIAIISDKLWQEEKNKYVDNIKNDVKYVIIEEPTFKYVENIEKDDSVDEENPMDLFQDIVEIK